MTGFKRLREYQQLCRKVSPRNPRDPAYRRHAHVCKLELGHPVSEGSGVQVHECGRIGCTIAWESDPRPQRSTRGIGIWPSDRARPTDVFPHAE